jgi:ubiquinone/menaquinone biosynthesis C-methylase UbiE
MTCHGGFSLDESIRRTWYNPETILNDAGLTPNMVFMDIGCGDGFFSILSAEVVGPKGRIYALDIDPSAIERLKRQASNRGLCNISATVGAAEDTMFCRKCADIIFFGMVLHDFNDPFKVLSNAMQMLKPNGHVVNLDWKKKPMAIGPPTHIRFDEEKAIALFEQAGFLVESVKEAGPHHYIITAKH